MNPLQLFSDWYKEEINLSKVRIPSACCLSTIGLDNYPNARFVSLKEIYNFEKLIIASPVNSRKGKEIHKSNKVALTFWWTETERQVRIQGEAERIPDELADKYFREREINAKIISLISEQGKEINSLESLTKKFIEMGKSYADKVIARPANWGGYFITPLRIEFLEFKPDRLHDRKLYELINGKWIFKQLQP